MVAARGFLAGSRKDIHVAEHEPFHNSGSVCKEQYTKYLSSTCDYV